MLPTSVQILTGKSTLGPVLVGQESLGIDRGTRQDDGHKLGF